MKTALENPGLRIFKERFSERLPGEEKETSWLYARRRAAHERFKSLGFPTRKHESWKYMDLAPILSAAFAVPDSLKAQVLHEKDIRPFLISETEATRIVFVNGVYSSGLSLKAGLPEGVRVESLSESLGRKEEFLKPHFSFSLENEQNPFALINTANFKDGVLLYLPKDTLLVSPIHILFLTLEEKDAQVYQPRVLVVAEEGVRFKMVENHVSLGKQKNFVNGVTEVCLEEGAKLGFTQIQRGGLTDFHFSTNRFRLKKDARLDFIDFSEGSAVRRNDNAVYFDGEHSFASLKGLSVLNGNSQIFDHVSVYHNAPNCVSNQVYKNILADSARSEFNSLVSVKKGASGSNSNQMNRNLLLSDLAQSFSRPQLRIDTDDVSCVHGATVGQLQKDELFYLRSRGFSKALAKFVLTYGFAEEILTDIQDMRLRKALETLVEEKLKAVIGG